MPSTVVLLTSITSFVGFVINVLVMSVVLLRGRRKCHLLFAPLLFITACWDLGIFLVMIRNSFPEEVLLYQNIVTIPVIFYPAFVYHFTTTYVNRPHKKTAFAFYAYCIIGLLLVAIGVGGGIGGGIYAYDWGNIARYEMNPILLSWMVVYFLILSLSCWLLFQARKQETSTLTRRHMGYVLASFIVLCVAQVKVLVTLGVDAAFTVPLGMLLADSFGALIGVAIVKHRLFDITVALRRGTVYSALALSVVFLFSFSEHLIATYLAGLAGELSEYLHFMSIAIVVGAFIPLKRKLDDFVEGYFARNKVTVKF